MMLGTHGCRIGPVVVLVWFLMFYFVAFVSLHLFFVCHIAFA